MIKVTFYIENKQLKMFKFMGHSGYAESGSDIICSAVSALTINTINSIEKFTSDRFDLEENQIDGYMRFRFKSSPSEQSILLINSLILGLENIENEYGSKYIKLKFKEV